jgi:Predicted membrane protein
MKKKALLFFFLIVFSSLLFAENFTIEKYGIDISVSEDRVYSVRENLLLDFNTRSHGFYRSIPYKYDGKKAIVKNLKVSDMYSSEKNGDYIDVKIGDADRYVSGLQNYTISYTYDLGDDGYADYDEFYYNIVGSGWGTDVNDVTFSVTFQKPVDASRIWATYGAYGSEKQLSVKVNGNTVSGHIDHLGPNDALTLRVEMDPGFFTGARVEKDHSTAGGILVIALAVLYVLVFLLFHSRYGRDLPLNPVVGFEPPEGLSPLLCGYITDSSADDRDVLSMVFYWADKGYLTIEDMDGKGKNFTFHRVSELPAAAPEPEKTLFYSLFKNRSEVTVDDIGRSGFARDVNEKVKPAVKNYFSKERAMIEKMSVRKEIQMCVFSILYLIIYSFAITVKDSEMLVFPLFGSLLFFAFSAVAAGVMKKYSYVGKGRRVLIGLVYTVVSLVVLLAIFAACLITNTNEVLTLVTFPFYVAVVLLGTFGGSLMEQLSPYGRDAIERTLGFREYIDKVEVDKLKVMIDSDPEYFYHVLSYAICFGLEDKWAKKFSGLLVEPASWYRSSNPVVDYMVYSSLYRRWNNAYRTTVVPISYPQSTGKGGAGTFSGSSGFSGGGFGGGGGRSW